MKIRLLVSLPIGKEHQATEGNEYEVVRTDFTGRGANIFFVEGPVGEFGVLFRECEVIENSPTTEGKK